MFIFAKSQIIRPAGTATSIALSKINKHLSTIERTTIFPQIRFSVWWKLKYK